MDHMTFVMTRESVAHRDESRENYQHNTAVSLTSTSHFNLFQLNVLVLATKNFTDLFNPLPIINVINVTATGRCFQLKKSSDESTARSLPVKHLAA